ncbi:hypothetical protein [Schinkia azotoformans]|uniref:hypothetical protein n=1 Tax=Schinkia azotoformans TaxID=1454 RepID=UPI002DBC0F5A|nr:hypothetical protein [Schinkia azotoformans]MEC1714723.1 hypothetical protein [Schinkia azotoformans]MEC1757521.1 hypothetical protein [Schinkia azotoformans]
MREQKYYLLAIDKTKSPSNLSIDLVWWGPNNCGYVTNIENAGIYTRSQIDSHPHYYNNDEVHPVPVEVVEQHQRWKYTVIRSEPDAWKDFSAFEKIANWR